MSSGPSVISKLSTSSSLWKCGECHGTSYMVMCVHTHLHTTFTHMHMCTLTQRCLYMHVVVHTCVHRVTWVSAHEHAYMRTCAHMVHICACQFPYRDKRIRIHVHRHRDPYTYIHTYIYLHMSIHANTGILACQCPHTCPHRHTDLHTHVYTCIHGNTNVHLHVHILVHTVHRSSSVLTHPPAREALTLAEPHRATCSCPGLSLVSRNCLCQLGLCPQS